MADTIRFLIEDDVPIPEALGGKDNYSPVRTTMRQLKVGQSFILYGEKQHRSARNAIREEHKHSQQRYTERKDKDDPDFYRVWRIK